MAESDATAAGTPLRRVGNALLYLVGPALFLGVWILFSVVKDSRFLPTPLESLEAADVWIFGSGEGTGGLFNGTWTEDVWSSTKRVMTGFAIALALAVPIGLAIGSSRMVARIVDPVIQLLRPIPITAWLPFSIVLFGIRERSAWFLIALGSFYPIVVNTADGAQHTPAVLLRAARTLGAGRLSTLRRVVFPNTLPFIFTGIRLGMGIAWVLVIVAELLAVQSGLGYSMWIAYQQFRVDVIVVTMASVGLAGFVSDRVIILIRNFALRWAVSG